MPSNLHLILHTDKCKARAQAAHGFSLIEILIVVAIIGILAAVAYPSYAEYVRSTRHSDAHLSLLSAAQSFERCKAKDYSYTGCNLPSSTSREGHYTMTLASDATTFTITATPTGSQSSDSATCTTITINHLDVRGFTGTGPCWT